MEGMMSALLPRFPGTIEHQVMLQSGPLDGSDERLDEIADAALVALSAGGPAAFALGPVASVNLDSRQVELAMTIEAHDLSDLHQKVALVVAELQRNEVLPLQSSETRETNESEDGDLVAA